jgi:hypothetical protein
MQHKFVAREILDGYEDFRWNSKTYCTLRASDWGLPHRYSGLGWLIEGRSYARRFIQKFETKEECPTWKGIIDSEIQFIKSIEPFAGRRFICSVWRAVANLRFGYVCQVPRMLRIFIYVVFGLESSRNVNKHISNMNHRAKGLDRKRCRNKKISLGSYQAAKNSVFNVLREVRSNGRTFVT